MHWFLAVLLVMSLFGGRARTNSQVNSKLLGYRIQTALWSSVIPILYGTNRLPVNVIWTGDWNPVPIKSGKKSGGGGKKGGSGNSSVQQYDYQTAMIMGVCQGPTFQIKDFWVNQVQMRLVSSSENFTIPGGGGSFTPSHASQFQFDVGVHYPVGYNVTVNDPFSPGNINYVGTQKSPFAPVSSSPGAGQYSQSGGTYNFSAADAGKQVVINYVWAQPTTSNQGQPLQNLSVSFFNGAQGQTPWGYLTTKHPDQAIGYSELCYLATSLADLGTSGLLPNVNVEVVGFLPFGGDVLDAEPGAVIKDFLTNKLYGVGLDSSVVGDTTKMSNYCRANGLFISPLLDQQRTAADWIKEWLTVANTEAVFSEGIIKFRPRGDTTAIGYGAQFTPDTQPIYDLDDDDYLNETGGPVELQRPTVRDAYNIIPIEWLNRGSAYNAEPVVATDDNAVSLYGARPDSTLNLHCITTQHVAALVANTQLKKSTNIRNTYTFKLGPHYGLLEPMDLLTISDPYFVGLKIPVRILSTEEADDGSITITAEEFPWGTAQPALHAKQVASSFAPGYFSEPGNVYAPIFFEAPDDTPALIAIPTRKTSARYTQNIGFELLIGLAGASQWGGCHVYESTDGGTSYTQVGTQYGPATRGFLMSSLLAVADPDTTSTLSVDLTESGGSLNSFTQSQADKLISLVLVDQELMAYETATLVGSNQYNLTYLRRGCFGTAISAHPAGAPFMVIDGHCFTFEYGAEDIGQVRHFKFTSFNKAMQQEQALANVSDYKYRLTSPRRPYPWKPSFASTLSNNFPSAKETFNILQTYNLGPDGAMQALLQIHGNPPLNAPASINPPVISATVSTTGGTIPGGQTILVGVFAWDSDPVTTFARQSLTSIIEVVIPSGTNTNSIALTVAWAAGSFGGSVLVGSSEDNLSSINLGISTGVTTATITDISLTSGWFLPDPVDVVADHLHFKPKQIIHGGVWGGQIASIVGNVVTLAGPNFAQNFAGRYLSLYAKADTTQEINIYSYSIVSNSGNALTLSAITGTAGLSVGDVVVIRTQPTTFTASTIGDSLFVNDSSPSGLTANAEVGYLIRIISGTGAGQQDRKVVANTSTVYTVDSPFNPVPDASSVFIVLAANWLPEQNGHSYTLGTFQGDTSKVAAAALPNVPGSYLVEALVSDSLGNLSDESLALYREVYLFGAGPPVTTVSADYTVQATDHTIRVDASGGNRIITVPAGLGVIGQEWIIKKIDSSTNTVTITGGTMDSGSVVLTVQWQSKTIKRTT